MTTGGTAVVPAGGVEQTWLGVPAVTILLELERRPRVIWDALDESEDVRLSDWLRTHPEYEDLIARAIELGKRAA